MFDFHEKRKIRRVVFSKFFIAFLFIIAIVIGRSVYERYTVAKEMATRLQTRTEELDALKTRALLLESKVEHLKNERGIEEELRSRFDVVKDGEQVVVILDDEDKDEVNALPEATTTEEKSFFRMFKFW
jgi:cell division protein FtsB